MKKRIYPDAHDALLAEAGGRFMFLLEQGVKQAASDAFPRVKMAEFMPPADKFLLHVVSMGAEEWYGQNRNGDSFSERALLDYHPNFTKYARFYREHRNRDPKLSIGDVKAAAYNTGLHRGELLIWGDKRKAEEEYEMLKAGKELSVSMSVRLPFDRCNCCEKKSASVADYCAHLRDHMNQWMSEFSKYAYARNEDDLKFFDISRVRRPADRIAHYIQVMFPDQELAKAASEAGIVIPGAAWAEFEDGIGDVPAEGSVRVLLEKLAVEEAWLSELFSGRMSCADHKAEFAKTARAAGHVSEEWTEAELEAARNLRPGTMFNMLAKRGAFLPPVTFLAWATGKSVAETAADPVVKQACAAMPSVFRSMLSGGLPEGLMDQFRSSGDLLSGMDPAANDDITKLMDGAAEKFTCSGKGPVSKTIHIIIKVGSADLPAHVPSAAVEEAVKLAKVYGVYQLAAAEDSAAGDSTVLALAARNFGWEKS
jgi:hypothetical protein